MNGLPNEQFTLSGLSTSSTVEQLRELKHAPFSNLQSLLNDELFWNPHEQ